MNLPVIQGVIDRRLLLNYHVDTGVIRKILPPRFRPSSPVGKPSPGFVSFV